MKRIAVLGSTGSIGAQTLDVVRALPHAFEVVGLAAGRNRELLARQAEEFAPRMTWPDAVGAARRTPMEEMAAAPDVDLVMVSTTGRAGLVPTLAALRAGTAVALANKEVIVMAGELVTRTAREHGTPLLPVDSEPSAIWQCLRGEREPVRRLIITASGGPFRKRALDTLPTVTPREALAHPTWVMGKKITVDSATLMNKGFEVIESRWLFGVPFERIDVVVHPQSVVHSMVECADGSVKAQMGPPDMRLPIQAALTPPRTDAQRLPAPVRPARPPVAHLRGTGRGPVPVLRHGRGVRAQRPELPRGPERGGRGGGAPLPRRAHRVHRHPPARQRGPRPARAVRRLDRGGGVGGGRMGARSRPSRAEPRLAARPSNGAPSRTRPREARTTVGE